jgi:hypothetical protein
MKLRFSLGGLLLATTLVGVACYWRVRPRSVAEKFASAVNAGRLAEADAMFHRPKDAFLVDFMARNDRNKVQQASVADQSIGEWLRGECTIDVALIDGGGLGALLMMSIPVNATSLGEARYTGGQSGVTGFFDPQSNVLR